MKTIKQTNVKVEMTRSALLEMLASVVPKDATNLTVSPQAGDLVFITYSQTTTEGDVSPPAVKQALPTKN